MRKFNVIAAVTLDEWGIGIENRLPWHPDKLQDDMEYFKQVTTKKFQLGQKVSLIENEANSFNAVIMGRKTWDSIPKRQKPLSRRINIIISRGNRHENDLDNKLYFCDSFESAIKLCSALENISDIYVCGGSQIYQIALLHECCERVLITFVKKLMDEKFKCDTFFPRELLDSYFNKQIDITEKVSNIINISNAITKRYLCKFVVFEKNEK